MACSSALPSAVPWHWVLEHIVGIKDIGTPILKEIMTYITDVEKNSCLLKRIALRYLEEILALGKIDAQAIPLVAALTKDSLKTTVQHYPVLATSSTTSYLLLRVQTEAILAYIREEPRNWQEFGQAIDHLLPEKSDDARFVERRNELQTLWQSHDRDEKCMEILQIYSINALRHDLFEFISLEKAHLEQAFLCQLFQDVIEGQYPLPRGLVVKSFLQQYSKTDRCIGDVQTDSVGSDDPTVVCGRNSAKKSQRASYRPEQAFVMRLRERDQDGKAVTSQSPLKRMQKCDVRCCGKDEGNNGIKTVTVEVENKSFVERFSDLGSDGNEKLCHKCRKDGKLLRCVGCPIAVHARCLRSHANTLIEQDWFCPICLHKRAAETVARAQQKERDARERLADFMAGLGDRITKERASHSSIHVCIQPEKVSDKSNATDCNIETDLERQAPSEVHWSEAKKAATASEFDKGIDIENRDYNASKKNANELLTGPDDTGIPSTSNANTKAKEPVEMNQGLSQDENGDGHDGDLEENSEDKKEDDHDIGRQKFKRKRDSREKSFPPVMRRKRLRWSKVEEDTLQEGVKKFSHDNGAWGFQWTRILEFGRGKFHPRRTDVDLKDKWRNLAKLYM